LKIIFLGTNGWYSTDTGNTTCVLIVSDDYYVILDAGDGLQKLDKYIRSKKPIILFLSHLHLDHIMGLHSLYKFRFKQSLQIYGNVGTKKSLKKLINHPYTASLDELEIDVEIHEMREGKHEMPFPFMCKRLIHADPCLGYRLELDGKSIAFCTDTGVCDNVYTLSENADLLISECAYMPGQIQTGWPHLRPEDAANIAKKSNVKQLILTHFDASIYRKMEHRKTAENHAKKIFQNTIAAYDGLKIKI